MVKKYKLRTGYQPQTVYATKPEGRENGVFTLSKCTQKELKYLHDVIRHPDVIIEDDGKESEQKGD